MNNSFLLGCILAVSILIGLVYPATWPFLIVLNIALPAIGLINRTRR